RVKLGEELTDAVRLLLPYHRGGSYHTGVPERRDPRATDFGSRVRQDDAQGPRRRSNEVLQSGSEVPRRCNLAPHCAAEALSCADVVPCCSDVVSRCAAIVLRRSNEVLRCAAAVPCRANAVLQRGAEVL